MMMPMTKQTKATKMVDLDVAKWNNVLVTDTFLLNNVTVYAIRIESARQS
jgi:hypothetical protein